LQGEERRARKTDREERERLKQEHRKEIMGRWRPREGAKGCREKTDVLSHVLPSG